MDTIVEFWDTHVSFHFSKSNVEIQLGDHTLYYLPKGYELTDKLETTSLSQYFFTKEDDIILLRCMKNSISKINTDSENSTIQPIEIPSYTAYALIPDNSEELNTIIWGNDEQSFMLNGNLPIQELTRMAKSLK